MAKYSVLETKAYHAGYKRCKRRGKDMGALRLAINTLANGERLAPEYRDHALKGKWQGHRECHIEPDWRLVYKIEDGRLVLVLSRTGTHSDLFDE